MKKGLKISLIVLGGLLAIMLLVLVLLPPLFKPQLLRIAQEQLNKQLNARIEFSDLDLSLFKSFPLATISLEGLSVVNKAPFEGDTLASLRKFSVSVDLFSLFDLSNVEVQEVVLEHPHIYAHRDSLGRANWEITYKDSTAIETKKDSATGAGASHLQFQLRRFAIQDAIVTYLDDSTQLDARLKHLDFELSGNLGLKQTQLGLNLGIDSVYLKNGALTYVPQLRLGFNAAIDADLENKVYKLASNEIALNDFILSLTGQVAMVDEAIDTDLTLVTNKADIPGLLSLIPAFYTQNLKGLKTTGTLQLSGYVKGRKFGKQLPDAELKLEVSNATVQYPALPKSVTGLTVDFLAQINGTQQDSSLLQLNNLSFTIGGNPVRLQANVATPITDPNLWATVQGSVDLATLGETLPLGERELTGQVDLDLEVEAFLSAVKNKQFESCNVDGYLRLQNVRLTQAVANHDALLHELGLRFSQKSIQLEKFDAAVANSDIRLRGGIENFLGYYFGEEVVTGTLELRSNRLDLRELLPVSSEEKSSDEIAASPTEGTSDVSTLTVEQLDLFRRIAFALRINIDDLFFQDYEMKQAGGKIDVKDGVIRIANLGCVLFDGDARISGLVDLSTSHYTSALEVGINHFDLAAGVKSVKTVRDLIPGIDYAEGHLGLTLTSSSQLDENFAPVLKTLNATGRINVGELAIKNAPLFEKFGEVLAIKELSNPTFRGGVATFEIENGVITFAPYEVKINEIAGNIGGQVHLDKTIDMTLNATIPSSLLGKLGTKLTSLVNHYVKDLAMPAKLPFWIRATGSVSAPKVDFGLEQLGTNNLKEVVKEKVEEVVDKAKERLSAEADKLIAEAERQAEQLQVEAKKVADRTREEAKKRAEQVIEEGEANGMLAAIAAKKVAEKIEKEGERVAEKIEREARDNAEKILAKAREEASKLK